MEAKCYIAIIVFAALSTVLGYMVFHRLKALKPVDVTSAAASVATPATPLLAGGQLP